MILYVRRFLLYLFTCIVWCYNEILKLYLEIKMGIDEKRFLRYTYACKGE